MRSAERGPVRSCLANGPLAAGTVCAVTFLRTRTQPRSPLWATSSPSTSSRASGTPATSPSTSTSRTGSTAPKPFQPGDENAFWFLDFHWSRGLTPLAATLWSADGYCWGTQSASEKLPLPPGRGITCRFAGTHLYGSPIPEADPREIGARANRLGTNLPHFLQNYRAIWEAGRDELEATWDYFQGVDFAAVPTADLGGLIQQGRRYHKRAMEIHFDVMYPMLVNFLGFYGACAELGIDTNLVGKFLQGEDTKIMELDRELYGLAVKARAAGLAQVFADHEPGELRAALSAHGGSASQWLTDFDDFLASTATAPTPPATSGCRAGSRTTPTRSATSRPSS